MSPTSVELHVEETETRMADDAEPLRYRLLTGADDRAFCERVSQALDEGYELYGSPTIAVQGETIRVAQAVVRTSS